MAHARIDIILHVQAALGIPSRGRGLEKTREGLGTVIRDQLVVGAGTDEDALAVDLPVQDGFVAFLAGCGLDVRGPEDDGLGVPASEAGYEGGGEVAAAVEGGALGCRVGWSFGEARSIAHHALGVLVVVSVCVDCLMSFFF